MTEKTEEEKAAEKKAAEAKAEKAAQATAEAEDKAAQEAVGKSEDLITKANAAAMRIEEANKEQKNLLDRQEAMQVEKTLGGTAEAGAEVKEETPEEYVKKVMANEDVGQDKPEA